MRQARLAIGVYFLLLVQGCHYVTWRWSGARGGGEAGTRYFALWAPPVGFRASRLGVDLELESYGGAPYAVTLDQYEVHFADLQGWAGSFVARRDAHGRCGEAAIHFQGVACRRHTFEYDKAGKVRRRVDTDYEWRLKGESSSEWAERWKGRTPPVTCVLVFEYAWSEDGRAVEVVLRSRRGKPRGIKPIDMPSAFLLRSKPGQALETWELNEQGAIVSVRRGGRIVYTARYDDAGRPLSYDRNGAKVANRYDAQGRLVERRIKFRRRDITVLHRYPDGPKVALPSLKKPGDEAWLVTHDANGWVSRIREHGGPADDIMANTFQEFRRDKDGRIVWRRIGFVLPNLLTGR